MRDWGNSSNRLCGIVFPPGTTKQKRLANNHLIVVVALLAYSNLPLILQGLYCTVVSFAGQHHAQPQTQLNTSEKKTLSENGHQRQQAKRKYRKSYHTNTKYSQTAVVVAPSTTAVPPLSVGRRQTTKINLKTTHLGWAAKSTVGLRALFASRSVTSVSVGPKSLRFPLAPFMALMADGTTLCHSQET